MEKAQSWAADEDEITKVDNPKRDVLVLPHELLGQGPIERVERVDGDQDHRESRAANELEKVLRVDGNGFKQDPGGAG